VVPAARRPLPVLVDVADCSCHCFELQGAGVGRPRQPLDRHQAAESGGRGVARLVAAVCGERDGRADLAQLGGPFEDLGDDAAAPQQQRQRESADPGSMITIREAGVDIRPRCAAGRCSQRTSG